MEAILVSTGLVAIAEIGDKTMLLAIALAATWRKPVPIILGILVATIANHALAALAGTMFAHYLSGPWMKWIIGLAFLAFAGWALIPDKLDDDEAAVKPQKSSAAVFWATTVAFFFVEMGDKTQIATAALAARFEALPLVVIGSTLGMMIANVPAVFMGEAAAKRLPLVYIRIAAAAGFALTGLWILIAG